MRASFFPIIFGLLVATALPSFAQNNHIQRSKFIQPILTCDYNNGTLTNTLGGISGGKESLPGTLYATTISDEGFTHGACGYSLQLDYNVENLGEYAFYWMKLGPSIPGKDKATSPLNLTKYNYISFWVKGAQEEGNIKIELHQDVDNNGIFEFGKDITSYVYANAFLKSGMITKAWQKVTIPLRYFSRVSDWSKVLELVFVFENKSGNKKGTIYVDDILFGYRNFEIQGYDK